MGLGQKGQKDGKILQPQISDFDELILIVGYPVWFPYPIFLFPWLYLAQNPTLLTCPFLLI